jgi:uncharacterized protein
VSRFTFVDSSAWFALYIPEDADHSSACSWLSANRPRLLTTDFIIDETLTLLRARGRSNVATEFGEHVFSTKLAAIHYLSIEDIAGAWEVFRRFADREWSFTDCTSLAVMQSLGIAEAFSFDGTSGSSAASAWHRN